jgi:hypothetical protein
LYPAIPVRQKRHLSGQPAWVEMQMVRRRSSGMKTLSMVAPSSRRKRYFIVPSDERDRSATSGQRRSWPAVSLSRSLRERSVMSSIEPTRRR